MRYAELAPSAALRPFVETFWTIDGAVGDGGHRVLPDGCMDLVFDRAEGARVVGAMTRAIVTPPAPRGRLFGVRFHPGEAAPFLRQNCKRRW